MLPTMQPVGWSDDRVVQGASPAAIGAGAAELLRQGLSQVWGSRMLHIPLTSGD
jgi:hypothetical protein